MCGRCVAVQRVMTAEAMHAEAERAERAVRFAEEQAAGARLRASQWRERARRAEENRR